MNKLLLLFSVCLISVLNSCSPQVKQGKMITVTIEPQRYFAEQLADSLFRIITMVPAGTSPETYDPSPTQMARLADSEAYFCIGRIGFEEVWMDKIKENNPQLPVYDNSQGVEFIVMEGHHHQEDSHDHHLHAHAGGVDPHTWSSPKEALLIAQNMCEAMAELDPIHAGVYRENLKRLEQEIRQTDEIVRKLLDNSSQKAFIIYHPALTYLAREYGLTQLCIEIDGKEPSPEQLTELIETSRVQQIRTIFIQQEFDRKNAEIIAKETGCRLVVINPLSYNWSKEIITIAKALSDE